MNNLKEIEAEIKIFKKIYEQSIAKVNELEKKRKELLKNE